MTSRWAVHSHFCAAVAPLLRLNSSRLPLDSVAGPEPSVQSTVQRRRRTLVPSSCRKVRRGGINRGDVLPGGLQAAESAASRGDGRLQRSSGGGGTKVPGLLTRCVRALCRLPVVRHHFKLYDRIMASVQFWLVFPWVVSCALIAICDLFVLLYSLRYFAFSEELMRAWLETVGVSLGFGFVIADTTVILVRNNINWTRLILATKRYQILEKIIVSPLVGIIHVFRKASMAVFD